MAVDHAGQWVRINAVFDQLLALPPEARQAHLDGLADLEPEARDRLERMLASLSTGASFLDTPAHASRDDADDVRGGNSHTLSAGTRVGAFVVKSPIGRGGMGEVYLAQRADADFDQFVALKLIHAGTTRLDHFEAERRILAALEHPNIARLIDGGVADDGRPYMAMEYVDGQDILAYAQAHALDLDARLALLRQVCDAVDHAHRNLVVHRDLKPANILVTAEGRAKLLDFGIAKLIDSASTDTLTQAMLTPEYAAPEQMEGGAITTATDVFALGVLLYELLAGVRPWHLQGLPLPGALRRMLEVEPPRPSEAGEAAAPVPARLLRGDLDAIVLKALRREPGERYQSAAHLWADIERHRQLRPVLARGDARSYRTRRFLRRYRLLVASTAAVVLALSIGLVAVTWQARRIAQERDQVLTEVARAEAIKDYLLLMFRTAGENQGAEPLTAKQVLDQSAKRLSAQYRDDPRTRAEIIEAMGALYLYMNDYDGAVPLLSGYLDSPSSQQTPASRAEISVLLAEAELRRGNAGQARRLLDVSQAFWNSEPRRYRKSLIGSRQLQAQIEKEEHGLPRSIKTLQASLVEHDAYFGRRHVDTANLLNSLGIAYQSNGDIDLADAAFKDSWAVHQALGNERTAGALLTLGNWAIVAYRKKDIARAEQLLLQATSTRRALYGNSAALAAMQANLGKIVLRAGRPQDALVQLQQALPMSLQYTGGHSPLTVALLQSIAEAQIQLGQLDPASQSLARAKDAARLNSGEEQVLYAVCLGIEARLQLARGDRAQAQLLAARMERTITALGEAGQPYLAEVERLRADLDAPAVRRQG